MPVFKMGSVVTSRTLPVGYYDCTVASFEESQAKNGQLMFVAEMRVNKPDQFKGLKITERFVVGKCPWNVSANTPEDEIEFYELNDPNAEDQRTVDRLMKPVKAFAEAAQWERIRDEEWDTDDLCEEITGSKVGVRTKMEDFNGRPLHKPAFFYAIGVHEPGVDSNTQSTARPGNRVKKDRTRRSSSED